MTVKRAPMRFQVIAVALAFLFSPSPFAPSARGQSVESAAEIDRLSREFERAADIRAIKRLQTAYAEYSQLGMWREMASLFAANARLDYGADTASGRGAIHDYFLKKFGGGREGLPAGAIHTQMMMRPVVNLSADGKTAKARWWEFTLSGRYGIRADWDGGIQENDYVKENGVWKFAHLNHTALVAGPYDKGWTNVEPDLKIVPYHFTAQEAGTPVPPLPAYQYAPQAADTPEKIAARLSTIEQRLGDMVAEDEVLNLQFIYGYYQDRKMWSDVVDLFTDDGALELADVGIYRGKQGIRRALELTGAEGLKPGQVNDHIVFNTAARIEPSGNEALVRGMTLQFFGETTNGVATIGVVNFENRFVRRSGRWMIREMRIFPVMKTDYYQGWAKSALITPAPAAASAPDTISRLAGKPADGLTSPAFLLPNPVTGKMPAFPKAVRAVASDRLVPAPAVEPSAPATTALNVRLSEARRLLRVASARDGVENIASAFGDWIDDFQWDKSAALFAENGWRGKYMVGFYVGPKRIQTAESTQLGSMPSPRLSANIHLRLQPVIHVAADGRSAKFRTRLFTIIASRDRPGTFSGAMYPNDKAVLENGVWKLTTGAIDEPYWGSISYKDGWARSKLPEPGVTTNGPKQLPGLMQKLVDAIAPDVPLSAMPVREKAFTVGSQINWPLIKPMWFHYLNPVSGRVPEFYCADIWTCDKEAGGAK